METSEATRLYDLLKLQSEQATTERSAQVAAFERALSAFRWELRIIVIVAFALGAARDGVFSKIGIAGVTVETRSAEK